jgi:alpha,alpha-trehalase
VLVDVRTNLRALLADEDTDGDRKITVDDRTHRNDGIGDQHFELLATDGQRVTVESTYYLANLLQELKLADESGAQSLRIDPQRILENPVRRVSRLIRSTYWDNLTRRVDARHAAAVLRDDKVSTGATHYLYVPHDDSLAFNYFLAVARQQPELNLRVMRLPDVISPRYVKNLDGKHGLLGLALQRRSDGDYEGVPYVVPGGRFNEMYGWDSYFEALGLLVDGRVDLAKAMVDNFVYQIMHYGKILNANRTYYLTRSQPPFLTSMILAVYSRTRDRPGARAWLRGALEAAIREYETVWMVEPRLTSTGLSRYFGAGIGPPPEVEPGHFDAIYEQHAGEMGVRRFERLYKEDKLEPIPELDAFFVHDRAVRESGHDTTYRWHADGDRCADFATVDLNSLLHKAEVDIARVIRDEFGGYIETPNGARHDSEAWYARARQRRQRMLHYLWDEDAGMFFDYDLANERRHVYYSPTCLYPLWAVHVDDPETRILDLARSRRLVANALGKLEMAGGLAASARDFFDAHPDVPARQWDYPNGWAPHQMLAWRALLNVGFEDEATRLIYRWLYTISRNAADYNGTIPEKFDVVQRSHRVFAEYGNVGTAFAYITKEGFGWMNASFQVGLQLLPPDYRARLEALHPPEDLF